MKTLSLFLLTLITCSVQAQSLYAELEAVDDVITWPWNWDVASDGERLVTVNEIGTLNIRQNGVWENIEIDPNDDNLEPRGVEIDDRGNIWITTLENGLWQYDLNGDFTQFNTSNSSLPVDQLRQLDIFENYIWISTDDGNGLIRYDMDSGVSDYFNMANTSQLKSDVNLDPYISPDGTAWITNRECLSKITPQLEWTSEDMRSVRSGGRINDIDFTNSDEAWLSMDKGLVKFSDDNYEIVIDEWDNEYEAFHMKEEGEQWIYYSENIFTEKLEIRKEGEVYEFIADSIGALPTQVFKMIEHQDTIILVGLLGNNIAKLSFDFPSSTDEENISQVSIYPNPAENTINIVSERTGYYNYSLYDFSGALILSGFTNESRIDLPDVAKGIYLLNLYYPDFNEQVQRKVSVIRN